MVPDGDYLLAHPIVAERSPSADSNTTSGTPGTRIERIPDLPSAIARRIFLGLLNES